MYHISRGSVWRIAKEEVVSSIKSKERAKTGPSPKLSSRQRRLLLRKIVHLREREGNFTCRRLKEEAGISQRDQVSVRTVSCFLNFEGYHYLQSRKKGLFSTADLKNGLRFARKIKREYPPDVWTTKIGFYLDATFFCV